MNKRMLDQELDLYPLIKVYGELGDVYGRNKCHGGMASGDLNKKQVEQSSDNRCVLWRTACVLAFESSFKWHTFLFLMLYCLNSAQFSENQPVCDGPIDRRTDRRTDGHTLL